MIIKWPPFIPIWQTLFLVGQFINESFHLCKVVHTKGHEAKWKIHIATLIAQKIKQSRSPNGPVLFTSACTVAFTNVRTTGGNCHNNIDWGQAKVLGNILSCHNPNSSKPSSGQHVLRFLWQGLLCIQRVDNSPVLQNLRYVLSHSVRWRLVCTNRDKWFLAFSFLLGVF